MKVYSLLCLAAVMATLQACAEPRTKPVRPPSGLPTSCNPDTNENCPSSPSSGEDQKGRNTNNPPQCPEGKVCEITEEERAACAKLGDPAICIESSWSQEFYAKVQASIKPPDSSSKFASLTCDVGYVCLLSTQEIAKCRELKLSDCDSGKWPQAQYDQVRDALTPTGSTTASKPATTQTTTTNEQPKPPVATQPTTVTCKLKQTTETQKYGLTVRSGPGTNYSDVGNLSLSSSFVKTGEQMNGSTKWIRFTYKSNPNSWASSTFLTCQ